MNDEMEVDEEIELDEYFKDSGDGANRQSASGGNIFAREGHQSSASSGHGGGNQHGLNDWMELRQSTRQGGGGEWDTVRDRGQRHRIQPWGQVELYRLLKRL